MANSKTYQRPNIFRRITVALVHLAGLGIDEYRAAPTWAARNYSDSSRVSKLVHLIIWAVKTFLVTIPNGLANVTFEKTTDQISYWLSADNPLRNHPWSDHPNAPLPTEADVVVIGAGFTGSACAYHWSKQNTGKMVVLEMNEAASGASGRNEGVVVMGRFFSYVKKMMSLNLSTTRKDLSDPQRSEMAKKFARAYVGAAYRNADMIEQTIKNEGFEVEYARNGWVQGDFASQPGYLSQSVKESADEGFDDWIEIEGARAEDLTGIPTGNDVVVGYSQKAATWHPAKWVWALLSKAVSSDSVSFFSRTRVWKVTDEGDHYAIQTTRGVIHAKYVINATESYTAKLHPIFHSKLSAIQTHAAFAEGGPDAMKQDMGMGGPNSWFGKHPSGVIMGTGATHVPPSQAGVIKQSRFLTSFCISEIQNIFGNSRMHVTREWSCTAGFTDDEFPIVGLIDDKRQYIIAGMCGSGSGVHFNGARHVISKILGLNGPDDYPEEFFSPTRILDPTNHCWPTID